MIITTIRRALRWWWSELRKPFVSDLHEPMGWDDASEPVEPHATGVAEKCAKAGCEEHQVFPPYCAVHRNEGHKTIDLSTAPMYGQTKQAEPTDRELLSDDEKALFEQISPAAPEKVIAYPPKADDQDARDWVTNELERRTGGLTRHPLDTTQYPEPPTEADIAAQQMFRPGARAMFSHGYSMRYLGELLDRAKRQDRSLSTEDLMALRSRGLI